jgi:hypothetical protein
METQKNESDIAPLLPNDNPKEKIVNKKVECCDFLQCSACIIIVFLSCFKP